jgi:starch phosphorylase
VAERFTNMTNGVTPRRWLAQANPGWRRCSTHAGPRLAARPGPAAAAARAGRRCRLPASVRAVKRANKERLAAHHRAHTGITVDPDSLFDVQVKRIHEYKRQLLNVLHVVTRYQAILADPQAGWVPRTVIFAGKAASYHMAKRSSG